MAPVFSIHCFGVRTKRSTRLYSNPVEFDGIKNWINSFVLTPKQWIEKTGAIGLIPVPDATEALLRTRTSPLNSHVDKPEFKIYLIKEFQRLKDDENRRLFARLEPQPHPFQAQLPHSHRRGEAHSFAEVTRRRLPIRTPTRPTAQRGPVRPDAGMARHNPKLETTCVKSPPIEQLLVLANRGHEPRFIHMDFAQGERLKRLNQIAIRQMQTSPPPATSPDAEKAEG